MKERRPNLESTKAQDPQPPSSNHELSRRSFLKLGAATGVGATVAGAAQGGEQAKGNGSSVSPFAHVNAREVSIADLQAGMEAGDFTSRDLVGYYLARIHKISHLRGMDSVIQTNPEARDIAQALDEERATSGPRGPLHGIPIILKDNIDTGDQMMTTAGSLALVGDAAPQDATVTSRLRDAGAIILGKANLSEWANFRGFSSSSGWSGVGGQCKNPYILDRNPCGSSSGSAASVSANLCAAALGTETDGSVVCPSSACGVVGIKPSVGLTSRAGVVPISDTQDTVGVHGRTVADAAAVLGALTGVDSRDAKTSASEGNSHSDYTQFLDPNGLQGTRIGVVRQFGSVTAEADIIYEDALQTMRDAGAEVVDVTISNFDEFNNDNSEITILIYEFKRDLNAYLATRSGVPVANLAEVIAFNLSNAEKELLFFGQEFLELAEAEIFSTEQYEAALARGPMLAGPEGIDATLNEFELDALVAPTNSPAWPNDLVNGDCFQFGSSSYAAVAGYPMITVPAGYTFDLPVGISFISTKWDEPGLIKVASGFEAARQARREPQFKKSLIRNDRIFPFKNGHIPKRKARAEELQQAVEAFLKPRLKKPFYL